MKFFKKISWLYIILLFVVGCSEVFTGEGHDVNIKREIKAVEKKVPDALITRRVRLGGFGDVLIHGRVYDDARVNGGFDFTPMVEPLMPYMSRYDILTANQETMIGGVAHGLSTYPRFNSPKEVGDLLKYMGVDIVNLANNHTLDRGEAVIQSALKHWDALDIPYIGSYKDETDQQELRLIEKNDIRFAFLGYTYGTNGIPIPNGKDHLVSIIDEEQMIMDIKAAKKVADVIVMHVHFGLEYERMPNNEQKRLAQAMIDEGVDVIFGHHPHVLQPAEWIEREDGSRGFVIYSLGNFLSGQDQLYRQLGGIVNITVEKTGNRIQLKDPEMLLTYVDFNLTPKRDYRVYPLSDVTHEMLTNHKTVEEELKQHYRQWLPDITFIGSD
ncbi:poly-gamma-glutamate synthesis protein (capsule biosynthesis protein) [Halolactibacillus alkaliphilus]|nr:poly-gamma-glutamate synthesis protein (capsule biosynthesis protein) [Halolactibacillus alkaliphilus]